MKKLKVLGLMALMTFALPGCQPEGNSEREEQLEQQVAKLEQQIANLEKGNDGSTSEAENFESVLSNEDTLDSLKDAVAKAVNDADNTAASNSRENNQTLFFEAKGALQEVEHRLDLFEDKVESQYRQGNLDYEKAYSAELELERLEDQLDYAEDSLEFRFGYDD